MPTNRKDNLLAWSIVVANTCLWIITQQAFMILITFSSELLYEYPVDMLKLERKIAAFKLTSIGQPRDEPSFSLMRTSF